MNRLLPLVVIVVGVFCFGLGSYFIFQGFDKNNFLVEAMRTEKITLGFTEEEVEAGQIIDTMAELQQAGDIIREHRHSIAPTYNEVLGGGQFDPTNPRHLTYSQAMNLENYLYLGVLSFGVVQIALGAGAFMIAVAIALWVIGIVLWRMTAIKRI